MTDTYLDLVNSGVTKKIATALGLPRPARLRRQGISGDPVPVTGTVVVLGSGPDADAVANLLLQWDLDVRRDAPHSGAKVHGIVLVLTDADHPSQMGATALAAGGLLRSLAPGGRVVTVSRVHPGTSGDGSAPDVAAAAAQAGVEGFLRSLAKEMRGGATANGILLAGDVPLTAPSLAAALHFFLSVKSAFVAGQFLTVSSRHGHDPADPDHPLAGQVAIVTGAARGIGEAIAKVLSRDGASVIGVDVPAAGEQLAAVMNAIGGTALQLDITSADAGERITRLARERFGRLDVVVHNAGVLRDKLLANMRPEQWDPVVDVNISAQLEMNEAFTADPALSPDGLRIVSLASTSGIAGNRGQTNYGYTKAAVIGMVEALAPVLTQRGGTINAVAPGFIETEMTASIPLLTRQVARRLNSLQQGGLPVDVAEAVAFLAAPSSGGITGETLRVCGQNLVGR